jgi:hypothetical protein
MAYFPAGSNRNFFSPPVFAIIAVKPALVPPNADFHAPFHAEFLQDVLNVLLHRARAATENLSDCSITLRLSDPFNHFHLTPG